MNKPRIFPKSPYLRGQISKRVNSANFLCLFMSLIGYKCKSSETNPTLF